MELEAKHIYPYLAYGLKVQYKGIVNTKELSAYGKLEPKDVDLFSLEYSEYWDNFPEPIEGIKTSEIKQIKFCKKYTTFHLGIWHGHLKTCFLGDIKPILRPLSMYCGKMIAKDAMKLLSCDVSVVHEIWELQDGTKSIEQVSVKTYNVMCENHIDFNRLIDANLAVDMNTIEPCTT